MRQVSFGHRDGLAVVAASALVGAALVGPAGATGKPGYGCSPGFNLGAFTFAEYVLLPRSQAAIDDGLATAEQIEAGAASGDRNGNGVICVQLSNGFEVNSRPFGAYYYNLSDDNASVPDQ